MLPDSLANNPFWSELAAQVPHLDQYFGEWAILEDRFCAAVERVSSMDLRLHITDSQAAVQAAATARRTYDVQGDVAQINMTGPLMKYASSTSGGTSTVAVRSQVRAAARDEAVGAILLRIDSPGGTVAGTADLAADIAEARKSKPVYAYIEDLGASAAYWLASQADKIFAGPTAIVGSIGTYAVIYDQSARAAMAGVKVHVIKAGEFKGAGEGGTPVSTEQLARWQERVNQLNEHFIRGVAEGRRMPISRVRDLADGDVRVGEGALSAGLIDGVASFDATLAMLQSKAQGTAPRATKPPVTKGARMSAGTNEPITAELVDESPKQASYEQIKAACVGADAAFIVSQLEHKATVAQATSAWMAEQNARVEKANKEAADAKAAAEAAKNRPGVEPVRSGGTNSSTSNDSADAEGQFKAAVADKVKAGMSQTAAHVAVCKENPELREAMVTAHNEKHLPTDEAKKRAR